METLKGPKSICHANWENYHFPILGILNDQKHLTCTIRIELSKKGEKNTTQVC